MYELENQNKNIDELYSDEFVQMRLWAVNSEQWAMQLITVDLEPKQTSIHKRTQNTKCFMFLLQENDKESFVMFVWRIGMVYQCMVW